MEDIPENIFNLLENYIAMVNKCFPDLTGKEAKRLYFITPIVVAVCSAFNGEVTIMVEEDMEGRRVKANGRFEMMIVKGNKRVCIVEAKKEDMEQGLAQCLLGCEVVADLDDMSIVYGVVTNYENWRLSKSTDSDIFYEELSLSIDNGIPAKPSLARITGKIYSMLLE
jgi:hypothetical protein